MKWVSKKCGLFAVFSAFSLLALFGVSSVSAASSYDSAIELTSKLEITSQDETYAADFSTDWFSEMKKAAEIKCTSGIDATACTLENDMDFLMSQEDTAWMVYKSLDNKSLYLVYNTYANNGIVTFVDGNTVRWGGSGTKRSAFFGLNTSHPRATEKGLYIGGTPSTITSDWETYAGAVQGKIFLSTYPITYPTGYEGEIIPDTWAPPRKPDFNYTVSSAGLLKVDYLDNAETKPDKAFEVQLTQASNDWEMPLLAIDERTISPAYAMGYEFQLPNPGYYHVGIFYEDESQLDGVALQFYWNGFSAVNGTTVGGCYDDDGVCNPELQETHPIVRILNSLPVNDFGLQQLVRAPIDFFATLPGRAEECSPIVLTMPFANAPVTLPCLTTSVFQPHFPTLLTIWQTVITGIVAYGVSIKIFATVKNVQTPDNDRIEVAKL